MRGGGGRWGFPGLGGDLTTVRKRRRGRGEEEEEERKRRRGRERR